MSRTPMYDETFYRGKSWGSRPIEAALDLPTLKLRYLMHALNERPARRATLLEVGSGSGRMLRSVRALDGELELTGIELDERQVEIAREHGAEARITYEKGDGQRLPFGDATFDFVCFLDYLEHIVNPQASLSEMRRVLRPGGRLIFVCPAEGEPLTIYKLSSTLFGRHFKERTLGHIQQFTIDQIEAMTERAGLRIIDRRYSYHVLGSIMDYALFTLLLHPALARTYWAHDKYHAVEHRGRPSAAGSFLNAAMTLGNAVAYVESALLQRVRLFASAVHVTAIKDDRPVPSDT